MDYRPDLPPLPARMRQLPVDPRGFPVPWFALNPEEPDGYNFVAVHRRKVRRAIDKQLCWTCGQPLGRHRFFAIGPMCAINRVTAEPPMHRECAHFAVRACPFLSRPLAKRVDHSGSGHMPAPGFALDRNPGVVLLYETRRYRTFQADRGAPGELFRLGSPDSLEWFACGRPATREEVEASIASGLPALRQLAEPDGAAAIAELERETAHVLSHWLPPLDGPRPAA